MAERIVVVGLGYVGLPVALAMATNSPGTIGFDIDDARVEELRSGRDRTGEVDEVSLRATSLRLTSAPDDLAEGTFFVVAVPTPVDEQNRPDLGSLVRASETVGRSLRPGAIVVFESTVYPGATEEVCGPAIERTSGLRAGRDFALGYSPERINPGDREHTLARITKVIAAQDGSSLERMADVYGAIVPAGIHRAPSIKVAEAAKVLENTQRDLNVALMNELALICDRIGIRTADVLDAAATKWNFLRFTPGLVGGHCIGVDPYYLTALAQQLDYEPEVILAGRRINDSMGGFVATKLRELLMGAELAVHGARVGVLGLTFKENVPDLRNSRVPDIVHKLRSYGATPIVHDPLAAAIEAERELGIETRPWSDLVDLDALILAVPHASYLGDPAALTDRIIDGGVLIDVKSALEPASIRRDLRYWSL